MIDAFEVLRLLRSIKNTFAPINRIPQELFSLIPRYWEEDYTDKNLIALTHGCQHWRKVLIAHSSLWTHFECKDIEKTRIYIERSKSSPLEIALYEHGESHNYHEEAFLLVIPHINRIASISISGGQDLFQYLIKHFSCHVLLLRDLDLTLTLKPSPALDNKLFNGDLSSLRTLSLRGVIPDLPWNNLSQLTTFSVLHYFSTEGMSVTRLLDFFSEAPRLSKIELVLRPTSSDAPAERVVCLPCLKSLTLHTARTHSSILLNHLSLPTGASLHVEFSFRGEESPLPKFLPKNPENLQNLLHVASAYLDFCRVYVSLRLDGPNGGLTMRGNRVDWPERMPVVSESSILRSLDYFAISELQRLAVTTYGSSIHEEIDKYTPQHVLSLTGDLHTLFLNDCNNLPFILALNPEQNSQRQVLCPKLENLVFYLGGEASFSFAEFISMAKERALKGMGLRSVVVISLSGLVPEEEVLKLREHVARVRCKFTDHEPWWSSIPDDGSN